MPDSAIAVKSPATRAVSFLKISLPSTGSSSCALRTRHAPTNALYTNLEPRRNAAVDRPPRTTNDRRSRARRKPAHRRALFGRVRASHRAVGDGVVAHFGFGMAGRGPGIADVLVLALGSHRGGPDV